ncbi:MAG: OsmC family peroxiredoxin [Cytophagales bacterium]|nr:MAG: OsmC family peroxiredoxin [Cytophagales bacterium]TAF59266.1 MAG: OsmC family peroxiredoxin [Cytophagales bacterium]
MKISLKRLNQGLHFEAQNELGKSVFFDAQPSEGGLGEGLAFSPMQTLLASLAACSVFDVVLILNKKRQQLIDIKVEAEGKRAASGSAKPFESINLHYKLFGKLNHEHAAQAVKLGVEKYCSVAESLSKNIVITHSFEIFESQSE